MNETLILTALVVGAALAFDFVNGFHDAANSIATIVATKILKPKHAVLWASFFNFVALFLFGTGVATTVGSGMIALDTVTPAVILCGLIGAIAWGLITWWMAIPTSSSHALLGGYAGAAMFNAAIRHGVAAAGQPIVTSGWIRTLSFIVIAPLIGLVIAHVLMRLTIIIQERFPRDASNKLFGRMQLFSSAFLSLMHGSNDAQKTAGIIAGVLVAAGYTKHFTLPMWVLWASYATMGLGTLAGGWRIVKTLGKDLTRLQPNGGFCAETAAGLSVLFATLLHLPVSTTHATTGAILGTGAARSMRSVRWSLAGNILWAWVFTIPAAAAIGGIAMGLAIMCGI
ncbi:MAG TPA: inorganic phosphate transporter [Alphaproteobacteria bacterium]|nr:inorganic phosphate transporter [Alphaproteobacteria bacterium]